MTLNQEQKDQLNNLIEYRDNIIHELGNIKCVLKTYFPEEYERAIQFYIPQISTALCEDKKWLSRGEYSLQNAIDNLLERAKITEVDKSIQKYL
jgi:hypothetical protein